MPAIQELSPYLSSKGRQTIDSAVSIMRQAGSSTLGQEAVILALAESDEYRREFESHGAGAPILERLFGVERAQPQSSGVFRVTHELSELIWSAAAPHGRKRPIKVGSLELLDVTMNHDRGRLRDYLTHAHMISTQTLDEQIADKFWRRIEVMKDNRPGLSIVA